VQLEMPGDELYFSALPGISTRGKCQRGAFLLTLIPLNTRAFLWFQKKGNAKRKALRASVCTRTNGSNTLFFREDPP